MDDGYEKPKGLDLSKLLAKAKKEPPPVVSETSPAAVSSSAHTAPSAPAASGVAPAGGQEVKLLITQQPAAKSPAPPTKPTSLRPTPSKTAPLSGIAAPKAKPAVVVQKSEGNAAIEQAASRQGALDKRLDYVQLEERRYPRGAFGLDEIYFFQSTTAHEVERVWRGLKEKPQPFTVELKIVGSVRESWQWHYDGKVLAVSESAERETIDADVTYDADVIIDQQRGKIAMRDAELDSRTLIHGDTALLRKLGLRTQYRGIDPETGEAVDYEPSDPLCLALKRQSKDPLDFVSQVVQKRVNSYLRRVLEPATVRLICVTSPPVELMFHFQPRRLNVLRGKPGEALGPASAELCLSELGLNLLWEGECSLQSLFGFGQLAYQGDTMVLEKVGLTQLGFLAGYRQWLTKVATERRGITKPLVPISPDSPVAVLHTAKP